MKRGLTEAWVVNLLDRAHEDVFSGPGSLKNAGAKPAAGAPHPGSPCRKPVAESHAGSVHLPQVDSVHFLTEDGSPTAATSFTAQPLQGSPTAAALRSAGATASFISRGSSSSPCSGVHPAAFLDSHGTTQIFSAAIGKYHADNVFVPTDSNNYLSTTSWPTAQRCVDAGSSTVSCSESTKKTLCMILGGRMEVVRCSPPA